MNRNTEQRFAELPRENIQRSTFVRDQNHKTTFNAGELIPFYIDEVLPADTHKITTTVVCRMSTPLNPTMDNAFLDIYYFFVPNRITWEHWREMMGENTDGIWAQTTEYQTPQISFNLVEKGDTANYMGIPIGFYLSLPTGDTVSALPFRAYAKIWNRWFRDQNVTAPVQEETGDALHEINASSIYKKPMKVYKFHDYFTSALPAPQKGDAIAMPLGTTAPVKNPIVQSAATAPMINLGTYIFGEPSTTDGKDFGQTVMTSTGTENEPRWNYSYNYPSGLVESASGTPTGLVTDLTNATAATINALRLGVQIQRILEKDARGGTRYQEVVANHFKTTLPSAQWQPEYLGGRRIPININQVLQTSETETTDLGTTGAYSLTGNKGHDVTKSFVEHGFILGLCCVRTQHTYQQGVEKFWSRKRRLDYYWPTLAHIGEQPIYAREIKIIPDNAAENSKVFGFQEAWAEYRYKPNRISGEFSSTYTAPLDSWHYGDNFGGLMEQAPILSTEFLVETKANIDRTLAIQSSIQDQFIADFLIENTTTRPMPVYSIPGLLDHF